MLFIRLFLFFTLVPFLELYLLMKLGAAFGVEITLLVVLGTGFLGAYLARREGTLAWSRIKQELSANRFPGNEIIDGFLVLISGLFLLTPGLLTDISGLLILIPVTRIFFREWIKKKLKSMLATGHTNMTFFIQ